MSMVVGLFEGKEVGWNLSGPALCLLACLLACLLDPSHAAARNSVSLILGEDLGPRRSDWLIDSRVACGSKVVVSLFQHPPPGGGEKNCTAARSCFPKEENTMGEKKKSDGGKTIRVYSGVKRRKRKLFVALMIGFFASKWVLSNQKQQD